MTEAKLILMDFPWDCYFGRQVQKGICRYVRLHRPWGFIHIWPYDDHNRWLRDTDAVGMISIRRPEDYVPVARRYGLAVVGVGKWAPGREFSSLPYADVDPEALGKMAADYFIERGFRNFGMIVLDGTYYSQYRGEAFVAALRRRKLTCDVFDHGKEYPRCGGPLPTVHHGCERIRYWLASLPKPLAVFCIDDETGLWVCEVCRQIGVHVPEEVAILGADDDHLFCNISNPPLSSIRVPAEQVGFEAAKLLDAVLGGGKVPKRPVLLSPMGVITRQSTDVLTIEDHYVAKAVRFIRENAHRGIRVKDVTAEVALSRRPLERRFKTALGRCPFSEIRRVQIEKIKTLLAQTDMTLEAIAPECGFANVVPMGRAFRRAAGISPGVWRKQFRIR